MTAISVVVPTYNRAELVRHAIDSVLAQTHRAAEIIVVDDGSSDNTPSILASYGSTIRVIRQENAGQSVARSKGVLAAQNAWIAFLDDDDEYTPEHLAITVESIARFPQADVHATNISIVTAGKSDIDLFQLRGVNAGKWMPLEHPLSWVLKGCFFLQSLVARRQTLIDVGLFRPTLYEDLDLFVRLVPRAPWVVDHRPSLRLIRRDNMPAVSDDWRSKPVERCTALARIHGESALLPGLSPAEVRMARQGQATYLFELAAALSLRGESTKARMHFREAARIFQTRRSRLKAAAAYLGGRSVVQLLQRLPNRSQGYVR